MKYAVSVIIPVFNQWELTRDCLLSLRETILQAGVQIVVVDNGSFDATSEQCPKVGHALFADDFIYIRNEENRNFGPACNQGARASAAKYLFFLNNDTIALKGWLLPLIEAMESDDELGAVGPLLLFSGGYRVQHMGIAIAPNGKVTHLYEFFPKENGVVSSKRTLSAISGAALFLKKTFFEECNGFFERYKNGYEDLDLCFTIRNKGKFFRSVHDSCFIHLTSMSSGRFDNELYNSGLILERYPNYFYPDLHRHYKNDGFNMQLNPLQVPYPAMPCEKIKEIEKNIKFYDIEHVQSLLLKNPLWENGYEKLAILFENQGDFEEANYQRIVRAKLCPNRKSFYLLKKGAQKHHDMDMVRYADDVLNKFLLSPKNRLRLLQEADRLCKWSSKNKENDIATAFKDWICQYS